MAKKLYEESNIAAIATKIREKTDTETTYKTAQMPAGVEKVYEAGQQAATDAFWDAVQNFGNRPDYCYAFKYWGSEYIRPKHKITTSAAQDLNNTFMYCQNLKKVESAYFDFSNHPTGATANANSVNYMFYDCLNLEEIEDIGIPAESYYYYAFMNCRKLHTIAVIRSTADTWFTNAFKNCTELVNIRFEGVVGKNINLSWSTKLTHDSIMSIINCLETKTSGTWTVTLGTENLAKLTDAEKAIATQKGWTLA